MNIHSVHQAATTPAPADDKREAILDAALELFSERTFDGTPVPLIAERAGVAAGTIYRYFSSKEALVNALYRRWKAEKHRVVVKARTSGGAPREQFGRFWRGLWRFACDHPRAVAFMDTHHHAPYLDAESLALSARLEAESLDWIREAQAIGAIRKADPGLIAVLLMGAFTGMVRIAGPEGLRYDERLIAETEEIMWSGVKA
jgi:AcrR family transcriptional regulator